MIEFINDKAIGFVSTEYFFEIESRDLKCNTVRHFNKNEIKLLKHYKPKKILIRRANSTEFFERMLTDVSEHGIQKGLYIFSWRPVGTLTSSKEG